MITRNTRELSNDYEEREYNRINFCIRYNLKVEKTLIAKLFFYQIDFTDVLVEIPFP